jgi:hypothetical protein
MQITDQIRFNKTGVVYSVDKFAADHTNGDFTLAMSAMEIMINRGDACIVKNQTPDQTILERALNEQSVIDQANGFDAEDEQHKDRKKEMKREGKARYPKVEIQYTTSFKAQEAQAMYERELRLDNIDLTIRKGIPYLVFYDITDAELNFINKTYKAEKVINATMGVISSSTEKVTKGLDYTAKKIATPIFELGAKSVVSILRSGVGVLTKTGATVITATSKGVKDTYNDITTDPDIIRARRELLETKSAIKTTMGNKTGANASGITIVY